MTTLDDLDVRRRLRRLELTVTRRLDGLLNGRHLGLLPGAGTELDSGREYVPGDDVRRMDWAVTARTTVPHVRDAVANRELETWVLIDASASMDFGTTEMEKRDLAIAAVAAIGFLNTGGGNRLGAVVATGKQLQRIPARAGRVHLLGLLRTLLTTPRSREAADTISLADAITDLHRSNRRRGLAVIVSDFLDGAGDSAAWEGSLRRLASRHQVLAVQVVDPRELSLPDVGVVTLVDPETGRRREFSTTSARLRRRFAAAAAAQDQAIAVSLRRAGVAHLRLRTDGDWVADIARHVLAQRRLTRAGGGTVSQGAASPSAASPSAASPSAASPSAASPSAASHGAASHGAAAALRGPMPGEAGTRLLTGFDVAEPGAPGLGRPPSPRQDGAS